jgi:hypothetical protein
VKLEMTSSMTALSDPREKVVTIGGDRRVERRYELELEIHWKLLHRRRVLDSGTGRTRDLSSHGVLFETGRALPLGSHIEASVCWPARLHGVAQLKLLAAGRVVRSEMGVTAIRMVQHEFRTAGGATQRVAPAGSGFGQ